MPRQTAAGRKRAAARGSPPTTRAAKLRKIDSNAVAEQQAEAGPLQERQPLPRETKIDIFKYLNRQSLDRVVLVNRRFRDIVLMHLAHFCLRLIVSAEISDLGLRRGTFRSVVKGLMKDFPRNRQEHAMNILELNYESQSAYKTAYWLTQALRSCYIREDLQVHIELGQFREFINSFGPVYVQGTLDIYGDLWRRIALPAFLDRFPLVTDVRTMTTAREEITDEFLAYCERRGIRSFRYHGISCPVTDDGIMTFILPSQDRGTEHRRLTLHGPSVTPQLVHRLYEAVQKLAPEGSFHLTVREDLTADRPDTQDMAAFTQFKTYDSHSTRRFNMPSQFFARIDTLSKYLMVWWRCEADNDY